MYKVGELSLVYVREPEENLIKITSSEDAYNFLKTIYDERFVEHREFAYIIIIDKKNTVIGFSKISEGGVSGTIIDPKIIFQTALLKNASRFVITHNHPSGNLTPSKEDDFITEKIKKGSEILDINMMDHIIYTKNGYYSYADNDNL